MTLEQWYSLLQVFSVAATALAFLSGAAVILVGLEVNRRNDLKVAQANERAATANERAGKLELEAAQMRDRATQTETRVAGLDERTAARRLTKEQQDELVNRLSSHMPFTVRFNPTPNPTREALTFQSDLIAVVMRLKAAHGKPVLPDIQLPPLVPSGVAVCVKDFANAPAARALVDALKEWGFEAVLISKIDRSERILPDTKTMAIIVAAK